VFGDNPKEIVLRHAERFPERLLDATRDRFAVRGPLARGMAMRTDGMGEFRVCLLSFADTW